MGLMAKDTGNGDFELIEEGVHLAVCYGIIDLGHQHNEKFDNFQHKVLIQWELPSVRIDVEVDGVKVNKPKAISRRFTLSLSEKSHLRPFLESWRGKKFSGKELFGFDIKNVLGANCQLQVLHQEYNDKTYANVHTVIPVLQGSDKIIPENPLVFYSMEDSELNYPETLPEWIRNIIMKSREYNETGQMNDWPDNNQADYREGPPVEDDDDLPF